MIKMNLLNNARVIYRRIGGRVIPIIVKSETRHGGVAVTANMMGRKDPVGKAFLMVDAGKRYAQATMAKTEVVPEMRGRGIGAHIFRQSLAALKKFFPSIKFLYGNVQHPHQISIRSKFPTKFLSTEFQPKGNLGLLSSKEARKKIKQGQWVIAVTNIKKK